MNIENTITKIIRSNELIEKKQNALYKERCKNKNLIRKLPHDIENLLIEVNEKKYLVTNCFKGATKTEFPGVKFSILEVKEEYNE